MTIFKYILSLFLLIAHVSNSFGQFSPKDENVKAMYYLQQNEIDSAKKYIDLAVENPELQTKQITWYYRAYIYKTLYKQREKTNKFSPLREEAVRSAKKAFDLKQDEQITQSVKKMLRNLAASYYNDEAFAIREDKDAQTAIDNFEKYKAIIKYIEPSTDFKEKDVEFKLALATLYNWQEPTDSTFDQVIADEAIKLYKEVLALDSNNASANYNLGILYYNKAGNIVNNMDYDEPLDVVNRKLDLCVDLFLKALPYMKKAYDLNWRRQDVLEGLVGIYYGLNDDEKYEKFSQELEALKNSNR